MPGMQARQYTTCAGCGWHGDPSASTGRCPECHTVLTTTAFATTAPAATPPAKTRMAVVGEGGTRWYCNICNVSFTADDAPGPVIHDCGASSDTPLLH
ncbi:hypothetical protein HY933_03690 [Candidatus Falkowbacteria bacterium]|nr:hypothetical protein [Candidatus Falkowbacteria bacterium]